MRILWGIAAPLLLVWAAGCPARSPTDSPSVSDVSSEFDVPGVLSARVRVQLVNPNDRDVDAAVTMEVLGSPVHEARRRIPAGDQATIIGPDAADLVRVNADFRDKRGAAALREQVFVIEQDFQEGDTIIVILADPTPPILLCPADVTIDCASARDPSVTRFAQASSECDASPDLTFVDEQEGTCPLVIRRTWTATDACGFSNSCVQTITVADTTPPAISCPQEVVASCEEASTPQFGRPSVQDNCDLDVELSFEDVPAEGCPEAVTRVWTARDDCGNTSTCSQLVRIVDTTPPELFCPADVIVDCSDSTDPQHTGMASAADACDPAPQVSYEDVPDAVEGDVIVRRWTAVDACGNVTTCEQRITVADLTPPVIICPADYTRRCPSSLRPQPQGPVDPIDAEPLSRPEVYDVCDPNPLVVSYSDEIMGEECPIIIRRTWTATDSSGNRASCVQVIRLTYGD